MKKLFLLLLMVSLHLYAFAGKDSLYVYTEWGVGAGVGRELSFKLGVDAIYKRHSLSVGYNNTSWPSEIPDDFSPDDHQKHNRRLLSYIDVVYLMYGRVWYINNFARFVLKGGIYGGAYSYQHTFVAQHSPHPGNTSYAYDNSRVAIAGVRVNPVLELTGPVTGGSIGIYAHANASRTGAGVEVNFLLGKLRNKRKPL